MQVLRKCCLGFSRNVFRLRNGDLCRLKRLKMLRAGGKRCASSGGLPDARISRNRPRCEVEFTHGGSVKLTYLAESFPHHFPSASLLYAVSSVGHPLRASILDLAKRRGLKVIVNQNGVAFPAWDGENYAESNRDMKTVIGFADFIIYQSRFCKTSAERYISPPDVPSEIIYNPVDIRLFTPDACSKKPDELTLLLGGNQYEKYRLELALQTLKALHRDVPNAKLIVTGNLWLPHDEAEEWTAATIKEVAGRSRELHENLHSV